MEEITKDKHEQYLTWLHEKYVLEKNTAEKAGMEKGIKIGTEKSKNEIAKRMLKEKMDISLIVKLTELTEEEIQALMNE